MGALFSRSRKFLRLASIPAALLGSAGLALAQSCPTERLAPFGLAPDSHCNGNGCLVSFKNYEWWTAFTFNRSEGFYNGGLGTIFAPEHFTVNGDGSMMLKMAKDWNNNREWAGAEAVLMFKGTGTQTPANLGYGDYLVAASFTSPPQADWSSLDPNVAFGLFTFERPATGTSYNPAREIDLAEISRWGWNHVGTCPFRGTQNQFQRSILCTGNAQFALQDFTRKAGMVQRYSIPAGPKDITLVMKWRAEQVTFLEYNQGGLTLATLPGTPDNQWTTPNSGSTDLSNFVPNQAGCQRFHINLWLGNYEGKAPYAPHDGPTNNADVSVVVKDFEFNPAQ